jgi:molybdopterin-guanine dinucleotide biosynthesis protein A
MKFGGIVLCGGQSHRMGWPKALLPFGPELMLQRIVRLLSEVAESSRHNSCVVRSECDTPSTRADSAWCVPAALTSPIVVVAAPGQELPQLPGDVRIAYDQQAGQGPLEGLRAGLTALAGQVEAAYATSCDVPLLLPQFVQRMLAIFQERDCQAAVPDVDGFLHPLAAVYSIEVRPMIEELLAAGRLRPVFLYDRVRTRVVTADELRDVDAGLQSLRNLNQPDDYLAALASAGFSAPPEVLARMRNQESENPSPR